MKNKDILNLRIESDEHDSDLTIKGYFKLLITALWEEGESFSGKRPFGNSGWEFDLYKPLIKHGVVAGEFDTDGYIESVDTKVANVLVLELIEECFK